MSNLGLLIALLAVDSIGLVVMIVIGVWSLIFQRRLAQDTLAIAKLAERAAEQAKEAKTMATRLLDAYGDLRNGDEK